MVKGKGVIKRKRTQVTPEVTSPDQITPSPPEVTPDFARFLGWLKKRSCYFHLDKCEDYWIVKGFDIRENIRVLGEPNFIYIGILNGKKVIHLKDQTWANQWMSFYGISIPHHRQMIKI